MPPCPAHFLYVPTLVSHLKATVERGKSCRAPPWAPRAGSLHSMVCRDAQSSDLPRHVLAVLLPTRHLVSSSELFCHMHFVLFVYAWVLDRSRPAFQPASVFVGGVTSMNCCIVIEIEKSSSSLWRVLNLFSCIISSSCCIQVKWKKTQLSGDTFPNSAIWIVVVLSVG